MERGQATPVCGYFMIIPFCIWRALNLSFLIFASVLSSQSKISVMEGMVKAILQVSILWVACACNPNNWEVGRGGGLRS